MSRDLTARWNDLAAADPTMAGRAAARTRRTVFTPHIGQVPILESTARFRIIRAGRRWGKTKVAARVILRNAIYRAGTMNWWVANTYKNVRRGYKEVVRQIPASMLAKPAPPSTSNELILNLKNGSSIEFYSAGNPDAMAGEGVDLLVGDEAALWPESVWTQTLRPTLADTHSADPESGKALLISTPRGRNWFWKLDQLGQNPLKTDYDSFHFATSDSPYIDDAEIEELRETLPYIMFQQEILAEYIAGGASIFKMPDDAIVFNLEEPYGHVVMGVDLGKTEDFTVITASRVEDRAPIYHERLPHIRWTEQRESVEAAYDYLASLPNVSGVTLAVDSTGAGDVVYEDLENDGYDVVPIKFSQQWKQMAVRKLAADLERGDAFILDESLPEFEAYEYSLTENGNYKFSAPEGLHDDEVSAKLVEHWALVTEFGGHEMNVRLIEKGDATLLAEVEAETEDTGLVEPVSSGPDSAAEIMARPGAWQS